MKKTALMIHHSLSYWGSAVEIDRWHRLRGWTGIGYHAVILNGYPTYTLWALRRLAQTFDGKIEPGRSETAIAAACREGQMNQRAIHVCLIGNFDTDTPTDAQWNALLHWCATMCQRHGIPPDRIYYHRDYAINRATGKPYKSCPGKRFPGRGVLRAAVARKLNP